MKQFRLGDTFKDEKRDSEYEILDKDPRPAANRRIARPLGEGGGGAVYRARYKKYLPRAIKFLKATDASHHDSYQREFDHLVELRHAHIVSLLDFGDMGDSGDFIPYLVMDLIEGEPLCERDGNEVSSPLASSGLSGTALLRLIGQLIDAVSYLHSERVLHGDIKGENLLVSDLDSTSLDRCTVTLLDLGSAHSLDTARGVREDIFQTKSTRVFFNTTKRIAHPLHRDARICNNWITRSQLADLFPFYDLYAIGVLLDELLQASGVEDWVAADLGQDTVEAIRVVIDRLTDVANPAEPYYDDVAELARDWARLDRNTLSPAGVPELTRTSRLRRTIFLPREPINITERIADVINSPFYQRLRMLPQLDFVSLIHPGATHSRLLHGLATYETARLYCERLLNGSRFRLLAGPSEVTALLLIALLHDIGHYALLHFFEDYRADDLGDEVGMIPTDDELFAIILDPEASQPKPALEPYRSSVRALQSEWSKHPMSLRDQIASSFGEEVVDTMKSLRGTIDGRVKSPPPVHLLLAPIISSELDADKVAYLSDDSHFTGVPYGLGIDRAALIASLREPDLDHLDGKGTLAIDFKGLAAAESVFLARQAMLRRVYWQKTNRAVMSMVHHLISTCILARELVMADLFPQLMKCGPLDALRLLESTYLLCAKSVADGLGYSDGITNPADGLRSPWRRIYKRVLSNGTGPDPSDKRQYEALVRMTVHDRAVLVMRLAKGLSTRLDRTVRFGDLLLDVPRKDRGPESDALASQVLVYDTVGLKSDLRSVSNVLSNLDEDYRTHANKVRVYLEPELAALFRERPSNREWLRDELRTMMLGSESELTV